MKKIFFSILYYTLKIVSCDISLGWSVNNNQISFQVNTDSIQEPSWWVGFEMEKDLIVASSSNNYLTSYNVVNIDKNLNTLEVTPKNSNYILTQNLNLNNNILMFEFSRFLDTGNSSDLIISPNSYLIVTIFKNNLEFPSKFSFMLATKINLVIPRSTITTNDSNSIPIISPFNQPLDVQMFYPTFFTYFLVIIFLFSAWVFQRMNIKFIDKKIFIPVINIYLSVGLLGFYILFTLWWIAMIIFSFMSPEPLDIMFRLGMLIILNMSFVFMPITRNSLFKNCFKISKHQHLETHIFIGILSFISVIIKFISVLIYFKPEFLGKLYNPATGGSPLAGTLATFSVIMMVLVSNKYIKTNFYEIFYNVHSILSIFTIITSLWHYFVSFYFLLPSIILYLCDIIFRYKNTRRSIYSKIENISAKKYNNKYVLINIKLDEPLQTNPGCYFLLCFKDISRLEWHPFSLVSISRNTYTFCAKITGRNTWTSKLKDYDNRNQSPEKIMSRELYIQGPYGYTSVDYMSNKYKHIILIATGIGITPIFFILDHIKEHHSLNKLKNLEKLKLVWIVPGMTLVNYFNEKIIYLKHEMTDIDIFVSQPDKIRYPSYVKSYKPNVKKILSDYINQDDINKNEVCVIAAGSEKLLQEVRYQCSYLNIDLSCEEF